MGSVLWNMESVVCKQANSGFDVVAEVTDVNQEVLGQDRSQGDS